jgi:hypothetical protein
MATATKSKATKVKVIYKAETVTYHDLSDEPYKELVVTAFLPEIDCNFGKITCYQHCGQHGEADASYLYGLRNATAEEYESLHKELSNIYGTDHGDGVCELIIKKRLNRSDLPWTR